MPASLTKVFGTAAKMLAMTFGLALASAVFTTYAAERTLGNNLFFIKRSMNDNEVHYDAVIDAESCSWQEPYVDSFWRDLDKGDEVYNKIGWWEKDAYGFSVTDPVDKTIEIRLNPLEKVKIDRPISVRLAKVGQTCRFETTIEINKLQSDFQAAFIQVAGLFKQSYDYFDILGFMPGKRGSTLEADRIYERFKKDPEKDFPEKPPTVLWQSGVSEKGLQFGRPL